ncbi:MAG: hypothetical protein L0Y42_02600 [Phycisphaerales bacterium]|nr:hypothetical protein [Phycisphaerales bacterium]
MLDRADELEIASLIEGELDEAAAGALRKRLSRNPAALALMERMQVDRAVLRTAAEPALPVDFFERIEPMLARPMLMEATAAEARLGVGAGNGVAAGVAEPIVRPGEWRRQVRRRSRRVVWSRLAVAAVVLMALMAGVWAAVNGVIGALQSADGVDERMARNDGADGSSAATGLDVERGGVAENGVIHHYRPEAVVMRDAGAEDAGSDVRVADADGELKLVPAKFVLVVQATDAAGVEEAVGRSVSAISERGALVRNFSFDEARKLEQEWRMARGPGISGEGPLVSSTEMIESTSWITPERMKILARRVRERLDVLNAGRGGEEAEKGPMSGQISGAKELAPTLEQQLDFSSRGATLTVSVPVADVVAFVERLNVDEGQATVLRMMPKRTEHDEAGAEEARALDLWLSEGPEVRRAVEKMVAEQSGAVVLIPVIVEGKSTSQKVDKSK